jgi:hypothetical protein
MHGQAGTANALCRKAGIPNKVIAAPDKQKNV